MKLLKASSTEFPQWYAEYPIEDLGVFMDKLPMDFMPKIQADIEELGVSEMYLSEITINYKKYIEYLSAHSPQLLIAHLYVRHFGDMYGGSMIKSKVPGSGTMYDFENKKELIETISAKLNEDLGIEANLAMQRSIDLLTDLS